MKLVDKIGSKDELENMNTRKDMNSMIDGNMKCSFSKDDTCVIHNTRGTVIHITTKKWKKNVKTGLFGNVSVRTRKVICKAKKIIPVGSDISTSVQSQRMGINTLDILGASGTDLQTDGLPDNL